MLNLMVESRDDLVGKESQLIAEALGDTRKKGDWACIWFNPPYKGQVEVFIGSACWVFQNGYGSFDLYDGMSDNPALTLSGEEDLRSVFLLQVLQALKNREELHIRTEPYNIIEYFYNKNAQEPTTIESTIPDASEIHGIFFIPREEINVTGNI